MTNYGSSSSLAPETDFQLNNINGIFGNGQTVPVTGQAFDFACEVETTSVPTDLADLPQQFPAATYGGRSGTDAWRADADARIEADRKSDVTVIVNDANGLPLDGAVVSVRQTEHEFIFRSAISAFDTLLDPNGNATALEY